jgi:phosphatidylglycerophosphate synthase
VHQVQQRRRRDLTAANVVTAIRIVLALALAASALRHEPRVLLGAVAGVALVTDFVDGRLARATGTTTRLGARLDQEADALLILVLSGIVAADLGPWVWALGLARYAFGITFVVVPALRTPPARPRPWCRTVAAATGIVPAAVVAVRLPDAPATAAVVVVSTLLAESFVHEATDRWRAPGEPLVVRYSRALPFAAVWLGLAVAAAQGVPTAGALVRPPLEALALVGVALVPAPRVRTWLSRLLGVLLAVLVVLALTDLGFRVVLDREFDPVGDWTYLGSGVGVLGDSIGAGWARLAAGLAVVAAVAVLIALAVATRRVVDVLATRRQPALRAAVGLAALGVVSTATGLPLASTGTAALAVGEVRLVHADLADQHVFARDIAHDRYADRAASEPASLLAGLAGKDVLLVFVESYGRVAVQDTSYSVGVDRVLRTGSEQLRQAGYGMRSGFLTSPTFGGGSWLAHSSLQSGLWVDTQRRYRQLLGTDRLTLTSLFGAAGWHTVFDVPADTRDWPQGKAFYGFEQYADSRNVGYAGPSFGYAPVPDQYTLSWFQSTVLAGSDRPPVFAEIDLVSSHHPWAPLPTMVPWDRVGDGSVYRSMPQTPTSQQVFRDPAMVRTMYGRSIEYAWQALSSFLARYADPNLVVVVLGDHQPHSYVSGGHVGHDVPISLIAKDPAVISRIAGWGWQEGLLPATDAPVWRMDTFRDRFLAAFDDS